MITRYVITSLHKDGLRYMVGDNNKYNTYDAKEIAEQKMKDIIENNSPERILELMGTDLQVKQTLCYPSEDSTRIVFGDK